MHFYSPAKVNVHLDIGALRQDGFHDICSWFLKIGLYDEIDIDTHGELGHVVVEGNLDVPPGEDIIFKASTLFYKETGIVPRCTINVRKVIPIGAGLGGGSSNAATVIMALNRLHSDPLTSVQLQGMAAGLGSDVPFFLGSPSAVVTGRGERTDPVRSPFSWWVLIIDPGFPVSTKDAFRWFDAEGGNRSGFRFDAEKIRCLAEGPSAKWHFFNAFSPVLFRRHPILENICHRLATGGAIHSGVSGSGSACFGIFDSFSTATAASKTFSGYHFWLKETLARSTPGVLQ
jgi:4-diphosphocytidyl-2-C-methyl-D-erythritol kinase